MIACAMCDYALLERLAHWCQPNYANSALLRRSAASCTDRTILS